MTAVFIMLMLVEMRCGALGVRRDHAVGLVSLNLLLSVAMRWCAKSSRKSGHMHG